MGHSMAFPFNPIDAAVSILVRVRNSDRISIKMFTPMEYVVFHYARSFKHTEALIELQALRSFEFFFGDIIIQQIPTFFNNCTSF